MESDQEPGTTSSATECAICGSPSRLLFRKNGYPVHGCLGCGHRFVPLKADAEHTERVYSDDYFFGGGDGYGDYLIEADLLEAQGRRYGELLSDHILPGRLLDVGSAAGFLQKGFEETGWRTVGLEPNRRMVSHATDELGLEAYQGSLETAPDMPPFDVVCLIQVIGHLHDLRKAIGSVSGLTRTGGLCLVEYWRRDSWTARVLGRNWHEYSPPSVLHWFSTDGLDRLFAEAGFEVADAGAPKKYIAGEHAKSLLSHKFLGLPGGRVLGPAVRNLPVPSRLRYPAFDLAWRLYRKL